MSDTTSPTISVLAVAYAGDDAAHFAQCLDSMFVQTEAADQFVLVLNGPLPDSHEQVVSKYTTGDCRLPGITVVRLELNRGLAGGLNAGLPHCTGSWIMPMDSEDIALHDRIKLQRAFIVEHPDIDIVGAWSEEFDDDRPMPRLKSSPVLHDSIVQALKWRNVLVHPSIVMRTSILRAIGGYRLHYPLLEDYDLYVRFALNKARFHVIPKVLVRFRTSKAQTIRRGGWRYCWSELRFRNFCRKSGFLSTAQFLSSSAPYVFFGLAGGNIRRLL